MGYADSINGNNNIEFFINLYITDEFLNKTNNLKDLVFYMVLISHFIIYQI